MSNVERLLSPLSAGRSWPKAPGGVVVLATHYRHKPHQIGHLVPGIDIADVGQNAEDGTFLRWALDPIQPRQIDAQHLVVHKEEGAQGLIVSG